MDVLSEKFKEASSKRRLEEIYSAMSLPLKKRKITINGGYTRKIQQMDLLPPASLLRKTLEETCGVITLPPKKRKLGFITKKNGGYPRKVQELELLPKLLSLGVNRPTWILRKMLVKTDLDVCESRLLLTSKIVAPTPLLAIFTNTELASVCEKTGLKLRAFDWLGREYKMIFKFLRCNGAYRVIGEWSRFLRENGSNMRVGDGIEIWAFRVPKKEGGTEVGMAFSHYRKDEELKVHGEDDEEEKVEMTMAELCSALMGLKERFTKQ